MRTLATILLLMASVWVSGAETNLIVINSTGEPPTVGMEGQLDIALPLAGLLTKPGDHRVPMLVRIASTQPHGTLTRYDLRYIGRVPGKHDLRDYLFTSEGQPATNLPALSVTIAGLLPNPHNGWLEEQARHAPSLFGGYRAIIATVVVLWVVAFFCIRRAGRKPKVAAVEVTGKRPPSFAERIRPLVERAAAGQLSAEQKAELERMLITHWQRRLHLTDTKADELISKLRLHNEAGEIGRAHV